MHIYIYTGDLDTEWARRSETRAAETKAVAETIGILQDKFTTTNTNTNTNANTSTNANTNTNTKFGEKSVLIYLDKDVSINL